MSCNFYFALILFGVLLQERVQEEHSFALYERKGFNCEYNSAVLVVAHRDPRLIKFSSFKVLYKLLVYNVLGLYDRLHVVKLCLRLFVKAGIIFVVLLRVKCFPYIFIHAAKVIYFFRTTNILEEKYSFLTLLKTEKVIKSLQSLYLCSSLSRNGAVLKCFQNYTSFLSPLCSSPQGVTADTLTDWISDWIW